MYSIYKYIFSGSFGVANKDRIELRESYAGIGTAGTTLVQQFTDGWISECEKATCFNLRICGLQTSDLSLL